VTATGVVDATVDATADAVAGHSSETGHIVNSATDLVSSIDTLRGSR